MPRSKTSKGAPRFQLSKLERMLLVLYHAVPVTVRADVGRRLFQAWTNPSPADRDLNAIRWKAAKARFQGDALEVNLLDAVQAGEALTGGGTR